MSHFSLMIVTKDFPTEEKISEILEPFDENLECEFFLQKTKAEFINEKRMYRDRIEEIYEDFRLDPKKKVKDKKRCEYIEKEYLLLKDMDDDALYAEATKWLKEDALENPESMKFDSEGNYYSTYNENAKWDWYQIGGRWSHLLHKKDGTKCDMGQVKDLDFRPQQKEIEEAQRFWEIFVEHQELKENEEEPFSLYNSEYYKEKYGSKEQYIQCSTGLRTFAVLIQQKDGSSTWHEKGEMHWFGMSGETPDEGRTYEMTFKERFLDTLDQEDYITIVDCHI